MVQIWGPTARAATLHRHLRRRVASLHALGRWETARVLLAEMRDARGELTPGVRQYAIAAHAAAVAHDRTFDERTLLDGRGWGDGSSSSSSLNSGGSNLSSYISAAVASAAAVIWPRDGQHKRHRGGGGGGSVSAGASASASGGASGGASGSGSGSGGSGSTRPGVVV